MGETGNNSLQQFREILGDMGFSRTKVVLGEWGLTEKAFPSNKTNLYIFTGGNFWIKKGEFRVFSGNYRTFSSEEIILGLMKVINKEEYFEKKEEVNEEVEVRKGATTLTINFFKGGDYEKDKNNR